MTNSVTLAANTDGYTGPVLPCPFCENVDLLLAHGRTKEARYYVFCRKCGANGPPAQRQFGAIMQWNSRRSQEAANATPG